MVSVGLTFGDVFIFILNFVFFFIGAFKKNNYSTRSCWIWDLNQAPRGLSYLIFNVADRDFESQTQDVLLIFRIYQALR